MVLILDVCGVLLAEPMAPLFRRVATDCGMTSERVARIFRDRFRQALWDGSLAEQDFWPAFANACAHGGRVDLTAWKGVVTDALRPTPTADRLPYWTARVQVWLLSNLRHEWLDPVVTRLGWDAYADRILVSSRTGDVKPAPAAYTQVLDRVAAGSQLLYIDDKSDNVRACTRLGISGIVADAGGHWMEAVDSWIAG
jgi:putative hydrolase of the HAD superfamily